MKALTDFFPLVIFFVCYQYSKDIILATGALIIATCCQVGYLWIRFKKVEKMHLITLALVVFFGGLTVLLQDPDFIKWKPTVINGLFALTFLGSQFIGNKNVVQRMLDKNMDLPNIVWGRLNTAWVLFFILSAVLNLYVAFNFSEETWVDFKVFGLLGLTILFVLLQGLYLSKYLREDSNSSNKNKE